MNIEWICNLFKIWRKLKCRKKKKKNNFQIGKDFRKASYLLNVRKYIITSNKIQQSIITLDLFGVMTRPNLQLISFCRCWSKTINNSFSTTKDQKQWYNWSIHLNGLVFKIWQIWNIGNDNNHYFSINLLFLFPLPR